MHKIKPESDLSSDSHFEKEISKGSVKKFHQYLVDQVLDKNKMNNFVYTIFLFVCTAVITQSAILTGKSEVKILSIQLQTGQNQFMVDEISKGEGKYFVLIYCPGKAKLFK